MDQATKKFCLGVAGVCAASFLAFQVKAEMHPLAGFWEPAQLVWADGTVEAAPPMRIFMKVSPNGLGSVASYWTCGAQEHVFGEGVVRKEGPSLCFYDYDWATRTTAESPNLQMNRTPEGRYALALSGADGPYWLEFERTENAPTVLDYLLQWR